MNSGNINGFRILVRLLELSCQVGVGLINSEVVDDDSDNYRNN